MNVTTLVETKARAEQAVRASALAPAPTVQVEQHGQQLAAARLARDELEAERVLPLQPPQPPPVVRAVRAPERRQVGLEREPAQVRERTARRRARAHREPLPLEARREPRRSSLRPQLPQLDHRAGRRLDRRDGLPDRLLRRGLARPHVVPVDQHGARGTEAGATAELRAGHAEILAQDVEQATHARPAWASS